MNNGLYHSSFNIFTMQKAEKRLELIKGKYEKILTSGQLLPPGVVKKLSLDQSEDIKRWCMFILLFGAAVLSSLVYMQPKNKCVMDMPIDTTKVFRRTENCDICRSVDGIDRVSEIDPADFDHLYAMTGRPVVVEDGTKNWTAAETFTFDFFKNLYSGDGNNDRQARTECQFFPYRTKFQSLEEVFNMTQPRSRLEPGTTPWYVGWSNCNDRAGQALRRHYNRPYFLSDTSENIALTWVFMGGPGNGAHMHVDNVVYPSWQAQLSGTKLWTLMPPPECLYQCKKHLVTVKPGQIIVLDTNRWYHQTQVLDGNISITIGSEFD